MNKKTMVIIGVCAALALLILVGLFATGTKEQTPPAQETEATAAQTGAETAPQETTAAETKPDLDKDVLDGTDDEQKTEESNQNETTPGATISADNALIGTEKDEDAAAELDGENSSTEKPTESAKPAETTKPTEATEPASPESLLGADFDIKKLTYEAFNAMTGEQQQAVIALFGSPEDFMVWYKAVEQQYKAEHPEIEIGADGNVNLG